MVPQTEQPFQIHLQREGPAWTTTVVDRFGVSLRWLSRVPPTDQNMKQLKSVHRRFSAGVTARN